MYIQLNKLLLGYCHMKQHTHSTDAKCGKDTKDYEGLQEVNDVLVLRELGAMLTISQYVCSLYNPSV